MDAKRVLLIVLFHGIVNIAIFAAEEESTPSRSAFFTTRGNKRLEGHAVKRFESPSLMSCSHSCLRNSWCSSTNFKEPSDKNSKGTCELNKHGVIDEKSEFRNQQGVTFSMFLKGCLMTGCLNGGSCVPDETKQTFSYSCKAPWTGEKCERSLGKTFEEIGCFRDKRNDRAMGEKLESLKGFIDWRDFSKTVQNCSEIARRHSAYYFAIQYYGECYGAPKGTAYDRYGKSDNCIFGVGKDLTNFVYRLF